jgi:hypothetical protein
MYKTNPRNCGAVRAARSKGVPSLQRRWDTVLSIDDFEQPGDSSWFVQRQRSKGAVYIHPTLAEGFWWLMEEVKPVDGGVE